MEWKKPSVRKNTSNESWFVYLLRCNDDSIYCGITNDLEKRLEKHNSGKGAKYTRSRIPSVIVYSEKKENKSEAAKREYEIKKMTRKQKLEIISSSPGQF